MTVARSELHKHTYTHILQNKCHEFNECKETEIYSNKNTPCRPRTLHVSEKSTIKKSETIFLLKIRRKKNNSSVLTRLLVRKCVSFVVLSSCKHVMCIFVTKLQRGQLAMFCSVFGTEEGKKNKTTRILCDRRLCGAKNLTHSPINILCVRNECFTVMGAA